MRILKKYINRKTKAGTVGLLPNDSEDLWYLYNLIVTGDILTLKSFRKIKLAAKNEYGTTKIQRKEIRMQVKVMKVDFSADERGVSLFVKCVNVRENEYVAMGQMQNIGIELWKPIQITKEYWAPSNFNMLNESVKQSNKFDSLILLCEEGYCGFYILKNCLTMLDSEIKRSMPKKRNGLMEVYNKKTKKFNTDVFTYFVNKYDISKLKLIVLAGPGHMKMKLYELMKNANMLIQKMNVPKTENDGNFGAKNKKGKRKRQKKSKASKTKQTKAKANANNSSKKSKVIERHKLLIINTSSTLKAAMDEVLKNKKVVSELQDTKAFKETQVLNQFYKIFSENANKAVYGEKEVRFAIQQQAISKLLISDSLLRSQNFTKRKQYLALYKNCARVCGNENIFVLSESHYSGQKLKEITGLAAILRFEIDLDSLYGEGNSSSESEDSSDEDENSLDKSIEMGAEDLAKEQARRGNNLPVKKEKVVFDEEEMRKQFEEFGELVEKFDNQSENFM